MDRRKTMLDEFSSDNPDLADRLHCTTAPLTSSPVRHSSRHRHPNTNTNTAPGQALDSSHDAHNMSSPSPSGVGSPSASPPAPLHSAHLASRRSSLASIRTMGPLSPTLTLSPSAAPYAGTLTSPPQPGLSPGGSSPGVSPQPNLGRRQSLAGFSLSAAGAALSSSYSAPLPANASVASQLSMLGSTVLPEDEFTEGATVSINQPVGSLSISPSSRDVCLASRKGLYILDLANLEKAPRFVPQGGTWQIAE